VSWQRYIAIGDSGTEGMGDPDGTGGFRGWADRLAEHLAAVHGDGRLFKPRVVEFNEALRRAAGRAGVMMVDVAAFIEGSDPRLWSDDRLHGNNAGHQRVAHALAHGLGLPGFDDSWRVPLQPAAPDPLASTIRADLVWAHQHALPWLWRTVRGRSFGEGVTAKRPAPEPVRPW
jgi:hypothetical protein